MLLAGADDYGGTLFEENISRLAGATAGQYIATAEFQERILELGRSPGQRNTLYTKYVYPMQPETGASLAAGGAA
jgi:2-iminoacetate synthase ThiH